MSKFDLVAMLYNFLDDVCTDYLNDTLSEPRNYFSIKYGDRGNIHFRSSCLQTYNLEATT